VYRKKDQGRKEGGEKGEGGKGGSRDGPHSQKKLAFLLASPFKSNGRRELGGKERIIAGRNNRQKKKKG